jgi:uncharacterized membrane protein
MPHRSAGDPAASRSGVSRAVTIARLLWSRGELFVRSQLVWNNLYRATSYLRSSLWVIPFISILLVVAVSPLVRWLDNWLAWRIIGLTQAGAQSLYNTVITLTLSFMVFTFGSLLVAIQVASGQLTPRIIATTLLRNNVVRGSVGLFVFTLIFAVMAVNRLETMVHEIVALLCAVLGLACLAMFLFLIDYAARLLRPVSIMAHVGDEGCAVIASVYPNRIGDVPEAGGTYAPARGTPTVVVRHTGGSEIVLAVDLPTLLRQVQRAGGVIECVPQVGDFLATGEPLFILHGAATSIDEELLRHTVAFGSERTMEQDPMFAFRILVDIGFKALSPAINDPTTAVIAIDQVQRLLRVVGKRELQQEVIRDGRGQPRLIFRTPNWEDFVHIGCTEIRACGASSVQIARRLRAMLDNLIATLPPHRHPALEQERRRLDQAIEGLYPIPEDLALARVPDTQGLGGSSGSRAPMPF